MATHGKSHSLSNTSDHSDGLQWVSLQTTVTANSASWQSGGSSSTIVASNSSLWNDAHLETGILLGTGLIEGGTLSVNADTTKFNITSGSGYVVDNYTNPYSPTHTVVSWSTQTALSATHLTTATRTTIMIGSGGNVVQQVAAPSPIDARNYIILGKLLHDNSTIINGVVNTPRVLYGAALDADDIATGLGSFNVEGNVISPNGANLAINKSAGSSYRTGANYTTSRISPNITTDSASTPVTFKYRYRNGSGGFTYGPSTTAVDPNNYDNGVTPLVGVTNNYYTIQRVYMFPGAAAKYVTYGQAEYQKLSDAKQGIIAEAPIVDPLFAEATLRCYMIVQQGQTNLTTTATFVPAGKLGEPLAGGSTGGDVVGPTTATNNALAAFDGTTGKLIKDSGYTTTNAANWNSTYTTVNQTSGSWSTATSGSFANGITIGNGTTGVGIKIDTNDPSYGWRDITGVITYDTGGTDAPAVAVFRTPVRAYWMDNNDNVDCSFHMPHDYVQGSDLFLHFHWSHDAATSITGPLSCVMSSTYARRSTGTSFIFPTAKKHYITYQTVALSATPQYSHRVDEIQITSLTDTPTSYAVSGMEVDGVIMVNVTFPVIPTMVGQAGGGATADRIPLLHVDLHYQSNNIGTKNKAFPFYL